MIDRPRVDPLRFHIGDKPLYIGMNDQSEFPFIKGMDPWIRAHLDDTIEEGMINMYDAMTIMYSLSEWKNGIRHNHETCKGRRFNFGSDKTSI